MHVIVNQSEDGKNPYMRDLCAPTMRASRCNRIYSFDFSSLLQVRERIRHGALRHKQSIPKDVLRFRLLLQCAVNDEAMLLLLLLLLMMMVKFTVVYI